MPAQAFQDAQSALGFVVSQTTYIERAVNATVYPDIQYMQLVPIDTSAPEWIKTVTFFSSDMVGRAEWINGNADDVPRASSERTKFETPVHMAGVGYGYGLEEINQARMLGIALESEDAAAARRAYEEFMDRVALFGSTEKGLLGLVNQTSVAAGTATTGDWATATPAEILADLNNALIGQYSGTLFTSPADTVLLPYERYLLLATRMVSTDGTLSILNWFLQNNVYTASTGQQIRVRGMRGLLTAGASGTARMVTYRRDPSVLKMHVPMPHKFLPAFAASPLRVEVAGIFRTGGVDVRRPKEMSYTDGI